MRDVKFRGKRVYNGDWMYGDLWRSYSNNKPSVCVIRDGHGNMQDFEVIPETLGQFTGLKDKNGVEIYEGDIVEIKTVVSHSETLMEPSEDYDQTIICKVYFNEAIASFDLETMQSDTHLNAWGFYGDNMDDFEVIGNIYQNPELLTPSPTE